MTAKVSGKTSSQDELALRNSPTAFWSPSPSIKPPAAICCPTDAAVELLLHAENDPVDSVNNSLVYCNALKKAGVAAEMAPSSSGYTGRGSGASLAAARNTSSPKGGGIRLQLDAKARARSIHFS